MRETPVNQERQHPDPIRRGILRVAGAVGLGWLLGRAGAEGATTDQPSASAPPWWMTASDRSRVVDVTSTSVFRGESLHDTVLAEMVSKGIEVLTGTLGTRAAWQAVLGDARRIVLKFNSVGAATIGTSSSLARVLVHQLADVGYGPDRVALVEAPPYLADELKTRQAAAGWGPDIVVDGQKEPVASYWDEADAVVSIGFLKSHRLAGMSGCMKNISHAVIRHPARHHRNQCSPAVGEIIRNTRISQKLRLCILDALRILIDGGPGVIGSALSDYGALFVGFDPLAVDASGLELLNLLRRRAELPAVTSVRYLQSGYELGTGRLRARETELIPMQID